MTKKGKIEKWGLEDEVIRLKDDEDKSKSAISRHIRKKYSDIPELNNISDMSVARFITRYDENIMEQEVSKTKDPSKAIKREFDLKMRESIQDAESARQKIDSYMNKLENKDLDSADVQRIISSWQKINDQYRKNLVAIREFTDNRIVKPTQNLIFKKEINIKNLLLDVARDLCPKCRKKVNVKLEEIENG